MEKGRRINKQTEKDSEDSSFLSSVTVPEALHWVGLDIYFFLMGFYYLFVFVKSQIKSRKKGKTLFLSLFFFSSIEAPSPSFLSKELSWW